jgi:hypothetical protein
MGKCMGAVRKPHGEMNGRIVQATWRNAEHERITQARWKKHGRITQAASFAELKNFGHENINIVWHWVKTEVLLERKEFASMSA